MRFGIATAVAMLAAAPVLALPTTTVKVEADSTTLVDFTSPDPQLLLGGAGTSFYNVNVGPGVLKVAASTSLPANDAAPDTINFQDATIGVTGSFTDVFTVDALGVSSGSFIAKLVISGALTAASSGLPSSGVVAFASSQIKVSVDGLAEPVFDLSFTYSNYNGFIGGGGSLNGERYTGPATGVFSFAIPFESLVGQTVTVSSFCGANVITLKTGDIASANCNYANTVAWGGITSVRDETNAPVSSFSVTGQSGTDYTQSFAAAVPEPSSWAMLIAGFGLIGAAARRQRQVRPA